VVRRCAPESEIHSVLTFCHSYTCGGHFGGRRTAVKVLQIGFFWPTLFRDAHHFCFVCERCQRMGALSRRDMMPLSHILIVEIFDVWSIDFMGPFTHLLALYTHWMLLIICQSGWKLRLLGPMTTRLWLSL